MRTIHKNLLLITLSLILTILFYGSALADETEFNEILSQLRTDGIVPNRNGSITAYDDYIDSYANMGAAQCIPVTNAEHFVLSSKIKWLSASNTPNGPVSGCGFIFGADSSTGGYLMISLRMDGKAYFTGFKPYSTNLSYGAQFFTNPSMIGEAQLTLAVDGDTVVIYVDGEQIFNKHEVATQGNELGFAILSGTNREFGTQCTFEDIYLYKW